MTVVLLTATITPHVEGHIVVTDSRVRAAQYAAALAWWSAMSARYRFDLVLAENSGYDLVDLVRQAGVDRSRVTLLSSEAPPPDAVSRGKGAAEASIIAAGIDVLASRPGSEVVYKCTGRLWVKNFPSCLPGRLQSHRLLIADIPRGPFDWVDSRLVGASLELWRSSLRGLGSDSDDRVGINFEHRLATVMRRLAVEGTGVVANFAEKPWFIGQSGTTGAQYGAGVSEWTRHVLLRPLDRLRRRRDAVLSVKDLD